MKWAQGLPQGFHERQIKQHLDYARRVWGCEWPRQKRDQEGHPVWLAMPTPSPCFTAFLVGGDFKIAPISHTPCLVSSHPVLCPSSLLRHLQHLLLHQPLFPITPSSVASSYPFPLRARSLLPAAAATPPGSVPSCLTFSPVPWVLESVLTHNSAAACVGGSKPVSLVQACLWDGVCVFCGCPRGSRSLPAQVASPPANPPRKSPPPLGPPLHHPVPPLAHSHLLELAQRLANALQPWHYPGASCGASHGRGAWECQPHHIHTYSWWWRTLAWTWQRTDQVGLGQAQADPSPGSRPLPTPCVVACLLLGFREGPLLPYALLDQRRSPYFGPAPSQELHQQSTCSPLNSSLCVK